MRRRSARWDGRPWAVDGPPWGVNQEVERQMTVSVEPALWKQNATKHADERLVGRRDPEWWFTGRRPDDARCPGLGRDGRLTSLPIPDLSRCSRADALAYFDNSWTLTEVLFAGLQAADAFYQSPD